MPQFLISPLSYIPTLKWPHSSSSSSFPLLPSIMSPSSRDPNSNRPNSPLKLVSNRPNPRLKLNKDSHSIHKPSSSAASATSSTTTNHRKHPVIIYISSPKVICTKAHDFMALVQKLTGLSHTNAREEGNKTPPPRPLPPDSSSFEDTCIVNNGDEQLTCSSTSISSSNSLTVNAVASLKGGSSEFLYSESPYLLYPELTEIISVETSGLVHGDYNYGDHDDFF